MAGKMDPKQISKYMYWITGKYTKPYVMVRKYLFSEGLQDRLLHNNLYGKVIPKNKFNDL